MASPLLIRGHQGADVAALKQALRTALEQAGINAAPFPGLIDGGDGFDADTEAALQQWQGSAGFVADGIAGPRVLGELGLLQSDPAQVQVNVASVQKMFPATKASNIERNLPYVVAALRAAGLIERELICMALATIRAETEGFVPISEGVSKFNTAPGKPPFSAYDPGTDIGHTLGNTQPGDGARFKGRGYVQLTGRDNYTRLGARLDIDLVGRSELANAPEIAASLLAAFLVAKRDPIQAALDGDDLKKARKLVNGGSHGLDRFTDAYRRGLAVLGPVQAARATGKAKGFTVPETLTVVRDGVDLRDRLFMPRVQSLAPQHPNDADVAMLLPAYTRAGLVLNQGTEGACTGFGLACVINYLRWRANDGKETESVSPRMLYAFARRYDEYDGEDYEGSSCRGALKGWHRHGVCPAHDWPYHPGEDTTPNPGWIDAALETTLGVYYRIDPKALVDLQAAIAEVGAIYVSAYTHPGWAGVARTKAPKSHADLPLIAFDDRPSLSGGHAFALVGFNRTGFVVQNSWGEAWGAGGFAVLGYADWLANAMDAWVAALGVPGNLSGQRVPRSHRNAPSGVAASNWDDETTTRHSIISGNDGRIDSFIAEDELQRSLRAQACTLPDLWFRTQPGEVKRLVIYAHGGLNSKDAALKRARVMGPYFTGNGCYPLFLVWKTGLLESVGQIFGDHIDQLRSGLFGADRGITDFFADQQDALVETVIGRPLARPIWSEMKDNAGCSTERGRGGDLLALALQALAHLWGDKLEIHLIGHSAGSILLGQLLDRFAQLDLGERLASVHLYAPACTMAFANTHYTPHQALMKRLHLHVLSDDNEHNDTVAEIYRKSLLYLVSNALETDRRTPLLGLEKVFTTPDARDWDGASTTFDTVNDWRRAWADAGGARRLHVWRDARVRSGPDTMISASHGSFDNNIEVIDQTLKLVTGNDVLTLPVDDLRGF
ncbi:peptidoglycan-binding protein [Jeongeupia naejangsanensis]|uniref:Peptidoglycan-binding protein n=1 Tax=Jeongeupia naejangsanensis TaxID=613195 RepID=A0ABS2BNW7_9NEIS|nr:peptidoglycan-binding protein [Jeongeupia naejangsanensis]MBM3117326.1 peptidoglycan-binding protein [Jeongeupia naejangsanensis]